MTIDDPSPTDPSNNPPTPSVRVPADYYSTPPEPPRMRDRRWIPIGCGAAGCLFLVLLFGGAIFISSSSSKGSSTFMAWFVESLKKDVEQRMAKDVPPQERAAFTQSFDALKGRVASGKASLIEFQKLIQDYRDVMLDGNATTSEVQLLRGDADAIVSPAKTTK